MSKVLKGFRRIRGRIIPIFDAHPTATGVALVAAAGYGASKVRQATAEQIQGKGKKSFGAVGNFAFELGLSAAGLTLLARRSARVNNSLQAFGGLLRRSFKGR